MDVHGASDAKREIEQLRDLLKQRQEEHAQELAHLRQSSQEATEAEHENAKSVMHDSEAKRSREVADTQEHYKEALGKSTDSYQKTLQEQRRDSYDRFGKLADENTRARAASESTHKSQIDDLARSRAQEEDSQHLKDSGATRRNQDEYGNRVDELQKKYIESNDQANRKRNEEVSQARNKADQDIFNTHHDAAMRLETKNQESQKQLNALRDQYEFERKNAKDVDELRAHQMEANALTRHNKEDANTAGALKQSRDMASSFYESEAKKRNQESASKDLATTQLILDNNHAAKEREVQYQARLAQAEKDVQKYAGGQDAQTRTARELDAKRSREDLYLATEKLRRQNTESSKDAARSYGDRLTDLRLSGEHTLKEQGDQFADVLSRRTQVAAEDRREAELDNNSRYNELKMKTTSERNGLVRNYQNREDSLEEERVAQLDSQRKTYGNTIVKLGDEHSHELYKLNRDHQMALEGAREREALEVTTLEKSSQIKGNDLQDNYARQLQRIQAAYNKATNNAKQDFEYTTEDMQAENLTNMHRVRRDTDQNQRLQLLDLQTKGRIQAANYESSLIDMKEHYEEEMNALKKTNELALRDIQRRNKDVIEHEQSSHTFELALRDRQMTDRLRAQEETFKDQIERLKRSNEITGKKS